MYSNQTKPNQTKPLNSNRWVGRIAALLMGGLLFLFSSCDAPTKTEPQQDGKLLTIPQQGSSPLPTGANNFPSYSTTGSDQVKKSSLPASSLLKDYTEMHPDHPYIAIIGVWNASKRLYEYKSIPLKFSPGQIKKSQGKLAYFYYHLSDTSGTTLRNLAGVLPATRPAVRRMTHWLKKVGKKGLRLAANQHAATGNNGDLVDNELEASISGNAVKTTMLLDPADCGDGAWEFCAELGGTTVTADAPDDNDDHSNDDYSWPSGDGPWRPNDWDSGDNSSGGTGGGGTGAGNDSGPTDNCPGVAAGNLPTLLPDNGDDNPYPGPSEPAPSCEDEEDNSNDNSADMFKGKIITADLKDHPKANCIYQKLDQTKTMQSVVSKFAGENTDFDLNIVVRNLDGYGELDSAPGINTFYMRLDEEGILQRKSIETAALFLHEAIHAEMRRYLRGATDESTLPGFPGNFTHDWKLFVHELYGGNSEAAEHEATAVKYRDVIAEGLKEYDHGVLTTDEYRALAWYGLSDTDYYEDVLTDNEKQAIVDNRESVLYKSNDSCN